ncbi:MAG: hypothetical protein ACRENE_20315 [Polyangiaceae bacterium]
MHPAPSRSRLIAVVLLACAAAAGGAQAGDAPKTKLRMVGPAGHVTEVHLVVGKTDTTIETFPTPQQVMGSGVSVSGHWAFVWHVAHPPQALAIYDLTNNQRVASFDPGFPGDLRWTHGDTLLHTWGCGTSCQVFRIYDTKGTVILEGSGGMHSESPSMRFMITGPATSGASGDIQLVDLQAAQTVSVTKAPAPGMAVVGQRWDEAHQRVEVKLGGAGGDGAGATSVTIPLPQ